VAIQSHDAGQRRLDNAAWRLHCKDVTELQEQIGTGEISLNRVEEIIKSYTKKLESTFNIDKGKDDFFESPIFGFDCEQYLVAQCCYPLPDTRDIVGITAKRNGRTALKIHCQSCQNIEKTPLSQKTLIKWNCDACTVILKLVLKDREEILRNILDKLTSSFKYNVRKLNPVYHTPLFTGKIASVIIHVLIRSRDELDLLRDQMNSITDVLQVEVKGIYPGIAKYNSD
jgi:(p)ppGpp synthase/HD superfamily hydrolase